MRPFISSFSFFFLALPLAMLTGQAAVGQSLYSLTTPGGSLGTASTATGINNRGQVTGYFVLSSESGTDVFFWDPATGDTVISGPSLLLGSVSNNYAVAINDSGLVAGSFFHFDLQTGTDTFLRPFTWSSESGSTVFTNNQVSANGRVLVDGAVADVNNAGTVVSGSSLWVNGVATRFDSILNDGSQSSLSAINDLGQVAGQNAGMQGTTAFIWDPTSGLMNIDTPFRAPQIVFEDLVVPNQLNNKAQVVGLWCRYVGPIEMQGEFTDDLFDRTAFLWSDGQIIDLGTLLGLSHSDANAINEDSITVGWSGNGSNDPAERRAVIWDSEQAIMDLNDLLDETGDGWILLEAHDINDAGQIVGVGQNPAGIAKAFLLTPALVLGDCDQDGDVDFADVPSFIDILILGSYLEQADCNQDGEVTFADIQTFIEILIDG